MSISAVVDFAPHGIPLTWRGSVDHVKLLSVLCQVFERVRLVKLEWVSRLRNDVNAHHLETRPMVSHARPTCS